jgi:hypothetical protein
MSLSLFGRRRPLFVGAARRPTSIEVTDGFVKARRHAFTAKFNLSILTVRGCHVAAWTGEEGIQMGKVVAAAAGLYLLALMFFSWGVASVYFELFPFSQIDPLVTNLQEFLRQPRKSLADIMRLDHQERPNDFDFRGLKLVDRNFSDDGYLLISRYSKNHRQTVVELFDIAANRILHTWVPDLAAIFAMTPNHVGGNNTRVAYRSQSPLLMKNGDIVIHSGEGPLVRITPCGKPVWAIDRHFHHSIELDGDGNLVVPIINSSHKDDNGVRTRGEGFAVVSPAGKVLSEYDLGKVMLDNGYRGLIYGVGKFEFERYHLNDVQPLAGRPASEGVLLSIRNLSSVALFLPATGKIAWLKTGPWLNQHDINDLGDGRYSIFGNDVVRGPDEILGGHSEIYFYRPAGDEVETPFSTILAKSDVHTPEAGRVTILKNGDAFIEETERDRLLRVSRDGVRWEYVNGVTDSTSGAIHWSRYLSNIALDWLENLSCG